MTDQPKRERPIRERIEDRLRDLLDGLLEALEGLVVQPQREPVRVRVRR